jgi:hypothetical protein
MTTASGDHRHDLEMALDVAVHFADARGDVARLTEVCAQIRADLGPTAPLTFTARTALERVRSRLRPAGESAQAWRQLLDDAEAAIPDNEGVLQAIREYAARYPAGDEDTVDVFREQLTRRRDRFGIDHYLAHTMVIGLADALRARGREADLAEASALARDDVAYRSTRYGDDHDFTWEARASLARVLIAEAEAGQDGSIAEAVAIAEDLVPARGRRFKWISPQVAEAYLIAAHALAVVGRTAEAARAIELVDASTAGNAHLVDPVWLAHVHTLIRPAG